MSGFKPYPAYKDSGVHWLGEIPTCWNVVPLKRLVLICNGRDYKNVEDPLGSYPVIGSGGEFARATDYLYEGESILLGRKGTIDRPLHVNGRFWTVDTMFYTVVGATSVPRFLYYSALTIPFSFYSTNTALPSMTQESLGSHLLAVPAYDEQLQIARFLDHETARIDVLIEEQQHLIELLKEKRQAVISGAVTKGLDPTVPMKDFGIEWIREVPAHWSVVPFWLAFGYQEGPGIMAVDFRDEGVPLVRISGVQGRWVTLQGCNYLDPAKASGKWGHFRLEYGDLIISGSASMGLVSEVGEEAVGAVAYTGLIRLTPKPGISDRDFMRLVVSSYQFFTQIDLLKSGSTIQHFGPTHLSQMKVVLPPLDEQIVLAAHVDKVSAKFDRLLHDAEKTNELLQERRSALISAAVTGKIDVRDWQPPATVSIPELAQEAQ